MNNKICILWDIENVTPSKDSMFVDGLLDFASSYGVVSTAIAVGNWAEGSISHMAQNLSEKGFELFHMPQSENSVKKKKNSSDFLIIAKATEMIFQLPHLDTYILLSGDIDYRPLLQTLKKHGKRIIVVCDSSTASENLLEFADKYADYRSLMTEDDSSSDIEESTNGTSQSSDSLAKEDAFSLLQEAVESMLKQNKIPASGSVKVKMMLLNEEFNGNIEGYPSWKSFINDAAKNKIIAFRNESNKSHISLSDGTHKKVAIPFLINSLVNALGAMSKSKEWVLFTKVNKNMRDKGIPLKKPYSKFKTLVLDAEKRNLVETKNEGLDWYVRRT